MNCRDRSAATSSGRPGRCAADTNDPTTACGAKMRQGRAGKPHRSQRFTHNALDSLIVRQRLQRPADIRRRIADQHMERPESVRRLFDCNFAARSRKQVSRNCMCFDAACFDCRFCGGQSRLVPTAYRYICPFIRESQGDCEANPPIGPPVTKTDFSFSESSKTITPYRLNNGAMDIVPVDRLSIGSLSRRLREYIFLVEPIHRLGETFNVQKRKTVHHPRMRRRRQSGYREKRDKSRRVAFGSS